MAKRKSIKLRKDTKKETKQERRARLLRDRTQWERAFGARLTDAGFEFDEQVIIGPYYADFVVDKHIVVELDGQQHLKPDAVAYDERRDKYMRARGFWIVRIQNVNAAYFDLANLREAPRSQAQPRLARKPKHKRKSPQPKYVSPRSDLFGCGQCGRYMELVRGKFFPYHKTKRNGYKVVCPGSDLPLSFRVNNETDEILMPTLDGDWRPMRIH